MAKWNAEDFKRVIDERVGKVNWRGGWQRTWHGMDKWAQGKPVALMLHHTGGASTSSKDPNDAGNQCHADEGQARYVWRHPKFDSPASQFTLRRCGQLDINAYLPCYHAGLGDFKGTEWAALNIPKDAANRHLMGVEIVSRGLDDDITDAQWATLSDLAHALQELAGWEDTSTLRLPRHKDWAPTRKVDIKASNKRVQEMIDHHHSLWDGHVPEYDAIKKAEIQGIANPAAWRLACRLADLGFYNGTPQPRLVQGYPAKAVANYNEKFGPKMEDKSVYGPKMHERVWGP